MHSMAKNKDEIYKIHPFNIPDFHYSSLIAILIGRNQITRII